MEQIPQILFGILFYYGILLFGISFLIGTILHHTAKRLHPLRDLPFQSGVATFTFFIGPQLLVILVVPNVVHFFSAAKDQVDYVGGSMMWGMIAYAIPAVYATIAATTVEIWKTEKRNRLWMIGGYTIGLILSAFLLFHWSRPGALFLLPVPLLAFYYFLGRGWEILHEVTLNRSVTFGLAGIASAFFPFWFLGNELARTWYQSLPDTVPPSNCFIVTAASRGHRRVVGRRVIVEMSGGEIVENQQLATFRLFEQVWHERAPVSHRAFRRFYNVWGYRASLLIRWTWVADLVYLLLKPVEVIALITLLRQGRTSEKRPTE